MRAIDDWMTKDNTHDIPHVVGKTIKSMRFNWTGGVEIVFTDGTEMGIGLEGMEGMLTLEVGGKMLIDSWNKTDL